jgi:hypothetical protein
MPSPLQRRWPIIDAVRKKARGKAGHANARPSCDVRPDLGDALAEPCQLCAVASDLFGLGFARAGHLPGERFLNAVAVRFADRAS